MAARFESGHSVLARLRPGDGILFVTAVWGSEERVHQGPFTGAAGDSHQPQQCFIPIIWRPQSSPQVF